jgi:hypothetical protein
MLHSLVDLCLWFPDAYETFNVSLSPPKRAQAAFNPANRIKVTVHTDLENHSKAQMDDRESCHSANEFES